MNSRPVMARLSAGALGLCGVLLVFFLIDRFAFDPRPLSGTARVVLGLLVGGILRCATSLLLLRTKAADVVGNLWLVAVSSLVGYLVIDLLCGALFISPLSPVLVSDKSIHHRLQPGTASYITSPEYAYTQHVNALGFRGVDVPERKPPDTDRIVMLGDSFTMGKGVSDTETFSFLLERALNRLGRGSARPHVEVLNGGVDSYAPVLSRLQLEGIAPRISPDLVVLNLDMSDLIQEQAYQALAVRDSNGTIVRVPAQLEDNDATLGQAHGDNWGAALYGFVQAHLLITRLLVQRVQQRRVNPIHPTVRDAVAFANPTLLRHTLASDTTNLELNWMGLFESIRSLHRYCVEHGITFLLTTYPWGHQVNERAWAEGRTSFIPPGSKISDRSLERLEAFARSSGLHFLSMFPGFRTYPGAESLYYSLDMHWTAAGHRVAAAQLEPVLRGLMADRR